jgi:hypothetical protein
MISLFAVLAAQVYHKISKYAILTQHEGFIQKEEWSDKPWGELRALCR